MALYEITQEDILGINSPRSFKFDAPPSIEFTSFDKGKVKAPDGTTVTYDISVDEVDNTICYVHVPGGIFDTIGLWKVYVEHYEADAYPYISQAMPVLVQEHGEFW